MSVHFLAELDPEMYELESPADVLREQGTIVIAATELLRIAEYATSIPTGPSPGRVYRRTYLSPDAGDPQPYVFVVVDAPDGDGQLHVPHRALVVA